MDVVRWLKVNLALSVAAVSVLSAIAGFLISGAMGFADMMRTIADDTAGIASLHADMRSVDGRLNTHTADVQALDKRVSLLEARLLWEASRPPPAPMQKASRP